jgi:hypothetical protein
MTGDDLGLLMKVFDDAVSVNIKSEIISESYSRQKALRGDFHGVGEYPLDPENEWIYRSTTSRHAPSVGSVDLDLDTFSSDAIVLDSDEFQSASSALILQESEEYYDWDRILAMSSDNM